MDEQIKQYEDFVVSCFNENPTGNKVLDFLHMTMALCSESGEFADEVKKAVFHSKETRIIDLVDELGDVFFYLTCITNFLGISIQDVMQANIIKIQQRYPYGRRKNYNFDSRDKEDEKRRIEEFLEKIRANNNLDLNKSCKNGD